MPKPRRRVFYIFFCIAIISALLLTVFPASMPVVAANTWYVSITGSDVSGNGSSGNPWRTIGHAVASSSVANGDTIRVLAGTYAEAVSTDKSLSFLGAKTGVDARDRIGSETVWVVPSPATPRALYCTASGGTVVVDGFKFVGGPGCVDLRPDAVVFSHNIVDVPDGCNGPTNLYNLVRLSSAATVTIEYNDISITEPTLLPGVCCIEVRVTSNPGSVLVNGNRFHNASGSGGFTFDHGVNAGTMTLTNNEVYDNEGGGITIDGKFDTLTATYNSIHDNNGNGIYFHSTGSVPSNVEISNCDIYGNSNYGIYNATDPGQVSIDAADNYWGDGDGYPVNQMGAAYGPDIIGVYTDPLPDPGCSPVATPDSYSIVKNTRLTVAAPGVLGNDTDPQSDPLIATLIDSASHGTLSFNANGSFTYDPASNFTGTDTFTYQAYDGAIHSNVATVTITVKSAANSAPTAVDDAYGTDAGTVLSVVAPGVLGNDTDPDYDILTALWVSNPANGTLMLNADGSFTYTPSAGYTGSDSFSYKARDTSSAESNIATVTISVSSVNHAPVAANDAYDTDEDSNLTVAAPGILFNDSDQDHDALIAVGFTSPSHGTLMLNANGSFTYTPSANYKGPDSFIYRAYDGAAYSAGATVSITVNPVNDTPLALGNSYATVEDTVLNVAAPGVLSNDSDIDGNTLTAVWLSNPEHGTLTLNPNGSFTYTPSANYSGSDSFIYQAFDGALYSAYAVVTIEVTAVNDPPVADNDVYGTPQDTILNVSTPGVLSNDLEVDGDAMTAILVTNTAHGTLTLNANGAFTYGPSAGYTGSDSFTYRARDTNPADSNIATVSITVSSVNHPPVAASDARSTNEDAFLTVAARGILTNDTDQDNNELTAVLISDPSHGILTLNSNGAFTYAPDLDYNGPDSFTYQAYDGFAYSNVAVVSITVNPVNDAPVAQGDDYTGAEDTVLTVAATGVLSNDFDVDGDGLTAVLVKGPSHGTLTLNANGSFAYTPAANYNGPDSFTYRAYDGAAYCVVAAAVSITVTPVNDPPVASGDSYSVNQYSTLNVTPLGVLSNDSDIDGDALTAERVSGPSHGALTLNANGSFTYTPTGSYSGPDSFTYRAYDESAYSDVATVNITVEFQGLPSIVSVDPGRGSQGKTNGSVVINGTWLGLTTSLDFGTGITVNRFTVDTATRISASVTVDSNAALGLRDVSAMVDGETVTLSDGFLVTGPPPAGSGWYEECLDVNSYASVYGENWLSQTLMPSETHYFNNISLWLYKTGKPTFTLTIALYAVNGSHQPTGSSLCSMTLPAYYVSTTAKWYSYRLSTGYKLLRDTEYALVLSGNGGDPLNRVNVGFSTLNTYSRGDRGYSTDSGGTWQTVAGQDIAFREGQHTLYEFSTSTTTGVNVYGQYSAYQTFIPKATHYLSMVSIGLYKVGLPTYTLTAALYNVDSNHRPITTGLPLCSTTFSAASCPRTTTAVRWYTFMFPTGYDVMKDTEYALVLSGNGGNALSKIVLAVGISPDTALQCAFSSDAGATWQTMPGITLCHREGQYPLIENSLLHNSSTPVYGNTQLCQTFTASTSFHLDTAYLVLHRKGYPAYTLNIGLYNADPITHLPVGTTPLCSTTLSASLLSTYIRWIPISFSAGYDVTKDTEYALVVSGDGGDEYNNVSVRSNSLGGYSRGQCGISTTGGSSWELLDSDVAFRVGQYWHEQSVSYNASTPLNALSRVCQTFTPSTSHYLNSVSICLARVGSKAYWVTAALYNVDSGHKPIGSPICSGIRYTVGMSYKPYWQTFTFSTGCQLSPDTEYALVVSASGGVKVYYNTLGDYGAGQLGTSIDGGANWQMMPDQDLAFKETQGSWCESYTSTTRALDVYGPYYEYQTFTPSVTHYMEYLSLSLYKIGSPNYTTTIALYNTDSDHKPITTEPPLCSTTFPTLLLARTSFTKPLWRTFFFPSACEVLAGTEYAIVVSGNGGTSSSKVMLAANPTGSYAGGQSGRSSDSGANWTTLPSIDAAFMEGQLTWREQYPSYSRISSGSRLPVYGETRVCQTFTPLKSHYFNYVSIPFHKLGSPNYTVTLSLYNVDAYHQPTGPSRCTTTLRTLSLLPKDTSWVQCRFPSGCWLSAGTEYALVISGSGGNALNTAATRINVLGRYTRGCLLTSSDGGTSWTVFPSRDLAFYEGGPLFW